MFYKTFSKMYKLKILQMVHRHVNLWLGAIFGPILVIDGAFFGHVDSCISLILIVDEVSCELLANGIYGY